MRPPNTKCSDGSEFVFLVRRGAAGNNDVVLEFQGGGACWSSLTCHLAPSEFKTVDPDVLGLDCTDQDYEREGNAGIGNWGDASNTWGGATMVFVPYCTQDLHWGNSKVEYNFAGNVFEFEHHGYKNAKSVLDWTFENLPNPDRVFVEGCSAGGYGALIYSSYVAENYKNTNALVTVGVDSSIGILAEKWLRSPQPGAADPSLVGGFRIWNAECAFPRWLGNMNIQNTGFWNSASGMHDLVSHLADHYHDMHIFYLTSTFDTTQVTFYQFMGAGDGATGWSLRMRHAIQDFLRAPNVRAFVVEGTHHCDLAFSLAYRENLSANGVSFVDWLQEFSRATSVSELPDTQICPTCGLGGIEGCDGVMGSGALATECNACDGTTNEDCLNFPPEVDADTDPNFQCYDSYFPVDNDSGCMHDEAEENLYCSGVNTKVVSETHMDHVPVDAARAALDSFNSALDNIDASLCDTLDRSKSNLKMCISRHPGYNVDMTVTLESCSETPANKHTDSHLQMPSGAMCSAAPKLLYGAVAETHALNTNGNTCGCL